MLRVDAHLEMRVPRHLPTGRAQLARHQTQERGLAHTVRANKRRPRVHVHAEVEVAVEVVLGITAVGEGHVVEGQHRRRELLDIGEAEGEHAILFNLLDEPIRLHLVEDLLPRLRLPDQVGVGTGGRNELLDVHDLFLLLVVGLHLVGLLLAAGLRIGVVVTTVVDELALAHVDHVRADAVEEIHAVRDEDQRAVPLLEVLFKPHARLQV